jgi:hypothetical protein
MVPLKNLRAACAYFLEEQGGWGWPRSLFSELTRDPLIQGRRNMAGRRDAFDRLAASQQQAFLSKLLRALTASEFNGRTAEASLEGFEDAAELCDSLRFIDNSRIEICTTQQDLDQLILKWFYFFAFNGRSATAFDRARVALDKVFAKDLYKFFNVFFEEETFIEGDKLQREQKTGEVGAFVRLMSVLAIAEVSLFNWVTHEQHYYFEKFHAAGWQKVYSLYLFFDSHSPHLEGIEDYLRKLLRDARRDKESLDLYRSTGPFAVAPDEEEAKSLPESVALAYQQHQASLKGLGEILELELVDEKDSHISHLNSESYVRLLKDRYLPFYQNLFLQLASAGRDDVDDDKIAEIFDEANASRRFNLYAEALRFQGKIQAENLRLSRMNDTQFANWKNSRDTADVLRELFDIRRQLMLFPHELLPGMLQALGERIAIIETANAHEGTRYLLKDLRKMIKASMNFSDELGRLFETDHNHYFERWIRRRMMASQRLFQSRYRPRTSVLDRLLRRPF